MNHTNKKQEQSLVGSSAIVTGATRGIGLGIAQAMASAGANLVVNGLGNNDDIARVIDELQQAGSGKIVYSNANMTEVNQIEDMVELAVRTFGSLEILVNNAGIQHVAPVEEFPVERWDSIIAVNLSACFHTIRCATPHLIANDWGRIINIASAHALIASPYKSAYVAAKHAVAGLTKTVALELAEKNITVNAIAPGYVQTELVEAQIVDTASARGISEDKVVQDIMLSAQPTSRFVKIDEVASLALFLCRNESRSITGSILPVDGGWTAQ